MEGVAVAVWPSSGARPRACRYAWIAIVIGCSALALMPPAAACAQQVPWLTLSPANGRLDVELTNVRSIRELADGRVLISDNEDNLLLVADLAVDVVESRGRIGRGPREFEHAGRLFALGGDSTLMDDPSGGRRWLLLVGDSITETVRPDHPLISTSTGRLRGTGRGGRAVYSRTSRQVRTEVPSGYRLLDSAFIVAAQWDSPDRDTIVRVLSGDQRVLVVGPKERPFYIFNPAAMSAIDAVAMFPDGSVAVASQSPYRVMWHSPAGTMARGPDLPWPLIEIDKSEKRAFIERQERVTGYAPAPNDDAWAEVVPPFGGWNAAIPLPDGRLALRKLPWSGAEETRYDVIDREGRLVGRLRMPENEWLVGVGAASVYRVVRDEDGLQWLHRHPWP